MSYWIIFAFALPMFIGLVFIFLKFAQFKLDADNTVIEPMLPTSDNPVGLTKEELDIKREEMKEAQKHLAEVIAKVPVEMVDGKFVPMSGERLKAELAARKAAEELQQAEKEALAANTAPVQIELPKEEKSKP